MPVTPGGPIGSLSRRRLLELVGLGAVGTAAAATTTACAADGRGNGGDGKSGKAREFHGAWPYQVPPKGHFNLMSGVTDSIGLGMYLDLIFLPGGMWYWKEQKWEPLLGEKWGFDEKTGTFSYTIRKGLTWNDGSPITGQDVLTTFTCRRVMRQTEWQFVNKVEIADDEHTVVFTMNNPSTVVERYVVRAAVFPHAMYRGFAKRATELFDSGGSLDDADGKKLNEDLQAYRPKNPEKEVLTSGPFRYDFGSITNAQLTLRKNDKGWGADRIKFDTITVFNGETTDVTPVVLAKNVDYATHGFPTATEKELIGKGFRIIRPPTYAGGGLFLNLDKLPEFRDVRARQGLAHAIDRRLAAEVGGDSYKPVQLMAGFSDILVPQWLSDADQARLNHYEHDQDKAASILTAAGWTRRGGRWLTPQGKPATYEINYPAEYFDYVAAAQSITRQLKSFGIQLNMRGVTFTQQPIDLDKGRFEFAMQGWGASSAPHPHFSFVAAFFTHNIPIAANQGGKGIAFPLTQNTKAFGKVDLEKVVNEAGAGLDEQKQRQNVAIAARAFNELLPIIPIEERYGNNPALQGVRVKEWPPDSDPVMLDAPYADNFTTLLMFKGKLDPA
ncbi:ABC transporter substrate-binding protein [Actinopolymorpha rutila]|uniref:Peptide/nickel transport system substrate-binding protein n=1 Tax=Actinopolymorpha rutila TaxID=446787 RepID=A0A852ZFK2_9ACTN|nr:peptide/nickel transport system substrate-binding protein [Actinopolymorpha rutila]